MKQTVYIETMGCQMNKLDSELIAEQLARMGYVNCDEPTQAGVIILNTCSVRQHAEDKVISKIGQLRRRQGGPEGPILAVVGCMAQRLGRELLENFRQVDVVCGPGQLHRLGRMIRRVRQDRRQEIALNDPAELERLEELDTSRQSSQSDCPFRAYVRIMRGCNKYCTYCVVPFVRGPERSRPLDHIVEESRRLVQNGVREITLLGQTVNSYKYTNGSKVFTLADVLEKLHEIEPLQRLRFVTSYPRDFDRRILQAMAELPKVCAYLHIPAQSGSDRILQAMNRRYTAAEYFDLIETARQLVDRITIAGDFIVGFCNEDESDFAATRDLMAKVRNKNCFIFKYSPRPGTRAARFLPDNVPEEVKRRRNNELLALQNEISLQDNRCFIGETVEILVEGPSKKPHLDNRREAINPPLNESIDLSAPIQLVGRTKGDHIVVFPGTPDLVGTIINVEVIKVSALTLFARHNSGDPQPLAGRA